MQTQLRHRVRDMFVATNTGLYHGHVDGSTAELSPIGLEGQGTVLSVAIDVRDANVVYAATRGGGFFRSDDHGRTWLEKSNGLTYREAWAIAQHPATGTLYLGTEPAAIFFSNDRGEHWTFCEKIHALPETIEWTFPHPPHLAHVKGIGLSPADPNIILGAIEEGYFIRSQDGGATWMTLKSEVWIDAHTITVMPDKPNVIVGATGHGIFRSEDGGDNFVQCSDGVGSRYCYGIVVHPEAPATLFTAGADGGPGSWRRRAGAEGANTKFFRSTDQGITWTALSGGLPELLTAAPRAAGSCPDRAGTYLVGMNDGTIFMTSDFGDSFSQIAGGLPPVYSIAIAP
jgi:photosystem II stability/assembly factor-like uncharacterized protein